MERDDVRCREVVEVLTDYLEGAMAVDQRAVLEQHLLTCEPCAGYLDQLRTSIVLTGRLQEENVPPQVMDKVLNMLEGQ